MVLALRSHKTRPMVGDRLSQKRVLIGHDLVPGGLGKRTGHDGNLHHRRAWQRVLREIAGLRAGASPAPESRKVAWNWKRGKKVEP